MSEPAKDEAALIKLIGQVIFYFGGEEDYFMENAEAALAIIRAAGWTVVPVEPTDEMLWAGENLPAPLWEMDNSDHSQFVLSLRRAEWAAMLAAAPGVKP